MKFEKSPKHQESESQEDARFMHSPKATKNEFALTELNLCAIFSQKGDHMKAKMYAHSSIYKLKQDLEHHQHYLLMEAQKQVIDEKAIFEIEEKIKER